jgi:hypothetical protein
MGCYDKGNIATPVPARENHLTRKYGFVIAGFLT